MPKSTENDELDGAFSRLNTADGDDLLIIGIDFGTTYSGIAYCFTGSDKAEPISILDWPGNKGANAPKVPTVISYSGADKKTIVWGYDLDQTSSEKIEGIKLLLDPNQPKPLYVPPSQTKAELKKLGKPAIDVATDYLEELYSHALTKIEASWPQDYLEMLQKKFVLSVPAVWSDQAKDLTLRAARNAGMHPITLIKEPEAAALYTLHFLKDKALNVGDAFVLCDAGGGTVDLISYEITKLKPLELKELVPGKGGLAGSLMLNKRFEQLVKDVVGEEQFMTLRKEKGFRIAMKQFDQSIKTAYMSHEDEFYVNFPKAGLEDDLENNLSSNCLTLTGEMVGQIFEPLIDNIQQLVDEQVNLVKIKRMTDNHPKATEIKAIFLVGGFGSSLYLKGCLQKAHPDIQVIQPHDAWSAIVKGAVMSQLPQEAVITSTVATKHYGVSANGIYREEEDAGETKIWDSYENTWRVTRMTWYILIGDDLQREKKQVFPFYRKLPVDFEDEDLVFEDELLESNTLKPAKYPKKGITRVNVTLKADLRSVPRSEFKKKQSADGKAYYEIWYKLALSSQTASMVFSLEINGKDIGKVDASYS